MEEITIDLQDNLVEWLSNQDQDASALVQKALIAQHYLCPSCCRPLHRFHDCEMNPVADPEN